MVENVERRMVAVELIVVVVDVDLRIERVILKERGIVSRGTGGKSKETHELVQYSFLENRLLNLVIELLIQQSMCYQSISE